MPYFDWKLFFMICRMTDSDSPAAIGLKKEAEEKLAMMEKEEGLKTRYAVEFYNASRSGDTVYMEKDGKRFSIPMLRQEDASVLGDGRKACLSLADFVPEESSGQKSPCGLFAITADTGTSQDLIGQAILDTLAEAASSMLDDMTGNAMRRKDMKIIKPAAGYPSLPDHSVKKDILEHLEKAGNPGITLSEKLGAAFVDMDQIQTHPTVVETTGVMVTEAVRGNGAVLINTQGKRFCDELGTRDVVSAAILKQPTGHAFMFFDEDVRKSLKAIEGYIKKPGMVIQGKTLDEVAKNMGVPADALKATMAQYAKDQKAGKDSCCGRTKMDRPLNKPGYYAIRITPAVHHTMGGVKINTKAEVLDTKGKVIPGYFAAGEVTGGVHGGNRLGGNAQADIIVFGRIAGQGAAAYAKAH